MKHLRLRVPRLREEVRVGGGTRQELFEDGIRRRCFPARLAKPPEPNAQLAFALKHEALNLAVLHALFQATPPKLVEDMMHATPTGRFARRAWHLRERLTCELLDLPDLRSGAYVQLADPSLEFTAPPASVPRQRILDNLLGDAGFCPTVRRTEVIERFLGDHLDRRCLALLERQPPELLRRAASHLVLKETKSSFAIEDEAPSASKEERFMAELQAAGEHDCLQPRRLVKLQNRIVDDRWANDGYRETQIYVGQTIGFGDEKIHHVGPKAADVPALMEGLMASHRRLGADASADGAVPAVVHAACIAWGFVFIHPFDDGNGRIHRLLIHNVLSRRGFTPPGTLLPVSPAMHDDPRAYDASLESFSRPLLTLLDYEIDREGRMTLSGDTAHHYRHPDLTASCEALCAFLRRAVEVDFPEELRFLERFDRLKAGVEEVVDLPHRLLSLLLRLLGQNGGRLSAKKRAAHFSKLTDDEVRRIEAVFDEHGEG